MTWLWLQLACLFEVYASCVKYSSSYSQVQVLCLVVTGTVVSTLSTGVALVMYAVCGDELRSH